MKATTIVQFVSAQLVISGLVLHTMATFPEDGNYHYFNFMEVDGQLKPVVSDIRHPEYSPGWYTRVTDQGILIVIDNFEAYDQGDHFFITSECRSQKEDIPGVRLSGEFRCVFKPDEKKFELSLVSA